MGGEFLAGVGGRPVSASIMFGVVKPALTVMPCTPRKSGSTLSRAIVATATGPTRASEGCAHAAGEHDRQGDGGAGADGC